MIHRFIDRFGARYVPLRASATGNYVATLTESPGQDPTQRTTPTANNVLVPILSPDGRTILFSHTGNLVEIAVDGSPGDEVMIWDGPSGFGVTGFDYSPDGSTILFTVADSSNRHQLYTITADGTDQSGNETVLYADPSSRQVCGGSYNFDGSKIAFHVLLTSTSLGIWTCDADGTGAAQIETTATVSSQVQFDRPIVAWMRGSSRLAWNDGPLATPVWKTMLDDGTSVVTLATLASGDGRPTWDTWLSDDSAITRVKLSAGTINKVAADGSGDSVLITPAPAASPTGSTPRVFGGRVYWASAGDIWSCLEDGTDARNETGASAASYFLE